MDSLDSIYKDVGPEELVQTEADKSHVHKKKDQKNKHHKHKLAEHKSVAKGESGKKSEEKADAAHKSV